MRADRSRELPGLLYIEPGATTVGDLAGYHVRLAELARAHVGVVHVVVRIDEQTPIPPPEVRDALESFVRDVVARGAQIWLAVETQGFGAAVLRGIATSLVLISPVRGAIHVLSSIDPALEAVAESLGTTPSALSEALGLHATSHAAVAAR
ncbi:MAG: hypothetical protein AB7S26_26320 [Sandaracinaceae bacterium]